jgi:hypothetical protein
MRNLGNVAGRMLPLLFDRVLFAAILAVDGGLEIGAGHHAFSIVALFSAGYFAFCSSAGRMMLCGRGFVAIEMRRGINLAMFYG